MSPSPRPTTVPTGSRPSIERAAAAARLAGAPSTGEAVAARMRQAAQRARGVWPAAASEGAAALAVAPVPRPTAPVRDEPARPRHLRVVPDGALTPSQRRRRARALVIAGIGTAAMIGLALVYFHVVLAQRQFALDHLQAQVQKAQHTYQSRRLEVSELGSPAHIISTAEGQLGMTQPSNVVYITPTGGGTVQSGSAAKRPLGRLPSASTLPASQAPAGDANWPRIKSQLAGIP